MDVDVYRLKLPCFHVPPFLAIVSRLRAGVPILKHGPRDRAIARIARKQRVSIARALLRAILCDARDSDERTTCRAKTMPRARNRGFAG